MQFQPSTMLKRVAPSWHLNIYDGVATQLFNKQTSRQPNSPKPVVHNTGQGRNTERKRHATYPHGKPQKGFKGRKVRFQLCTEQPKQPFSSKHQSGKAADPKKDTKRQSNVKQQQCLTVEETRTIPQITVNGKTEEEHDIFSKQVRNISRTDHFLASKYVAELKHGAKPQGNGAAKDKGQHNLQVPRRKTSPSSEYQLSNRKTADQKRDTKPQVQYEGQRPLQFYRSQKHINKPCSFEHHLPSVRRGKVVVPRRGGLNAHREESNHSKDEVSFYTNTILEKIFTKESQRERLECELRKHSLTEDEVQLLILDIVEPLDIEQMILQNKSRNSLVLFGYSL